MELLVNQVEWKRFAQPPCAAHHNLLARRAAFLPAHGIVGYGIERAPKSGVKDCEKLPSQLLFRLHANAAPHVKVLNGDVVVFELRRAHEADDGSAGRFTAKAKRIVRRGGRGRGYCLRRWARCYLGRRTARSANSDD